MKKQHRHTISLNSLPKKQQNQVKLVNSKGDKSSKLPHLHQRKRHISTIQLSQNSNAKINSIHIFKGIAGQLQKIQFISQIRQKAKLFAELKSNILVLHDNTIIKKLIAQIKYISTFAPLIQIWENVQLYSNCQFQHIKQLEQKYQIRVDQDFLKTMDYVNNLCRYSLAEYKKKMWSNKQKQINRCISKMNKSIGKVQTNVRKIQDANIKLQIISSIGSLRQDLYAKKQHYLDWRSKALQKLKKDKIHCEILRAQVFAQELS